MQGLPFKGMKIIKEKNISVDEIVSVLEKDGLVIMPTETMYGAMVDATNSKAVAKLSTYKNRPLGKPFSIAVTNKKMAEKYVFLNKTAENIYKTFLPGPVTVISKGKHKVAHNVESENGTLGVRIPDYLLVTDVIKKLNKPITATSANASYKKRPYEIADITNNLSQKQINLIDLIIDAGKLPTKEPSTVIDTTIDDSTILRQGEIKFGNSIKVLSRSEENTQNIAKELWQKYEKFQGQRAIVFALEGPMGAGKTQFTKGLARALGIKEEVVSPSFDIEINYEGKLAHLDVWRIKDKNELEALGFSKLINDKTVIAIEWADKVSDIVRKYSEDAVVIWVKIKYGKKENERLFNWKVL